MRSIRDASALLLGLAAAACGGSTEPHVPAGLNGNFGITGTPGFWLGLTLHESGGVVSGSGWSGDLIRLRRGITVTGTYQAPAVELDLLQHQNGQTGHFSGTFVGDTLRGVYVLGPNEQSTLELTRIDTVPTGEYVLHLTGAVTGDFVGEGVFTHAAFGPIGVGLSLDTDGFLYRFGTSWDDTNRPPAGVYPLTSAATPHRIAVFGREEGILGFRQFPFLSGTFTLQVSTRWAMIGHFDFTATDPASGGVVTAHATFNTGCVGVTC